ncbi:MAG: hypothetical protein OXH09_20320 [Gammaproteobacteria bacterium]|nr:hypothetical protein [Gammaproteobacteria bacterium]
MRIAAADRSSAIICAEESLPHSDTIRRSRCGLPTEAALAAAATPEAPSQSERRADVAAPSAVPSAAPGLSGQTRGHRRTDRGQADAAVPLPLSVAEVSRDLGRRVRTPS